MDAHVISLANQKGGTAKTTTCANLGIGLAQAGRKVLLVDADAQGSLTLSLGWEPDELPITLYDLMIKAIQDRPVTHGEGMLHHEEGADLLPANIELAGLEVTLVNSWSASCTTKRYSSWQCGNPYSQGHEPLRTKLFAGWLLYGNPIPAEKGPLSCNQ